MNKLEVINYDLDLDLGCGSPAPRSLYRPASPVDWLETAERELNYTKKGSSEGQSPRRSFFFEKDIDKSKRVCYN